MNMLANIITTHCIKKNIISKEKKEIYMYGFKLIIADIINFLIIILLGTVFKRIFDSIVFLVVLCGLRQFTGGFHAKTFWLCRTSMIITYFSVMFLNIVVLNTSPKMICAFNNFLCVIIIFLLAPIENVNKQLTDRQKKSNKLKSLITSIILSVVSIIFVSADKNVGVTISTTLSAVVILMFVGKIKMKGGHKNV